MHMIGKIDRVPLRDVWKHEAYDFTKWLQDNIDVLNDASDLSLTSAESEKSAGDFSVDLVAEDSDGNPVIIENQLEKSNHDHLGKLITYLTALEAKAAVWIVAAPRPEHVRAVSWLNESSSASFYLLKVEAIRIGQSPPAPLLTQIVGPSEESRQAGEKKKEIAERYGIRQRFWTQLLERARARTQLHATISPGQHSWVGTGAGKAGLAFNYVVRQHEGDAELYIDRGKDAEEGNKLIFDQLAAARDAVEKAFDDALEWQRLEGKRGCRIRKTTQIGGYRDEEKWPDVHDAMIDAMVRLEGALRPHVDGLKL